jgi:plasmid stability protein
VGDNVGISLEDAMASITVRNLDDGLKRRLRIRAAEHGRSMEEEVREILRQVVGEVPSPENLGEAIHRRFAALGGVDLELPPREPMPAPPSFE